MSDQWYYSRDGKEDGPFPYAVLQQMAKVGDLLATDKLREATAQEWRVAADFPDLFVTVEPRSVSSDSSSLKGLTMALGIEPAKPGHDPLLGCDIGGVTIVRLIAEGGMGRVYEGKQEKPKRTVAVKVMRPGLTSPSVLKRFEYEAEVLGRLQHPGIAHIYSVGVHRLGNASVPYFIMEYIADAKTLTQYANDLKLSARQRLDLFRSVCTAVSHGHQKGVIHRDLKPSNILVDGSGQPKVIDFGVARATDSDMALTTMQTDIGQLIGTLQYMSPEQFKADPNDIDVRSDVYALGVILYELLSGRMPYDIKKKAIHEVARIVQEDDPTSLSSWNRALKGDMAVIAGKCLEKDRDRRYSSASEVGADIGRYLKGDPISASPPRFIDGLVRLAKRHRTAAVAMALVFAALVVAVVGIGVFATHAERERTVATRRLYEANLYRIQRLLKENNHVIAKSLFEELSAHFNDRCLPIELRHINSLISGAAVTLCEGHTDQVWSVAFSPDGKRLATGSSDNTARLWDATSGKQLAVLEGHDDEVFPLAFSPDGTRLATGSSDNTARLWDATSGKHLAVLQGHDQPLFYLAFSPDGTRLATESEDETVRLWDSISGTQLLVLGGHSQRIRDFRFSPDGARLATGSEDKTARLWDTASGKQLAVLKGHDDPIMALAFSPDGTRLATGSEDKTARLWDTASGLQLAVLEGHGGAINRLAFSSDGKRLVTGSEDKTARLWDTASGLRLAVLEGHGGAINRLALSPDGKRLATASCLFPDRFSTFLQMPRVEKTARLWDAASGKQLAVLEGHSGQIEELAFSPDGTRLATVSEDRTIRLWDATSGTQLAVLEGHRGGILDFAFSPDGTRLATASEDMTARLWDAAGPQLAVLKGHGDGITALAFNPDSTRLATASSDKTARLWETASGKQLAVLNGHDDPIIALAFSPDGARLATGSEDKTARLWDTASGKQLAVLKGHDDPIMTLAFSPDGTQLATGSEDKTARLWDTSSGIQIAILKGHSEQIMHLAFGPDGARVATASFDKTARLWDTASGKQLAVLGGHNGKLICLAFSPDGTRLATGGAGAWLWDTASGKQLAVLAGHDDLIMALAFSPDGTRLAAGGAEGRLWDAASGKQLAVLTEHGGPIFCLGFSPDGTRLATASFDKTVRLWDSTSGTQLAVLEGHDDPIMALAFSPDGTRLATGSVDQTARLWGLSNTEIYQARLKTAALEHKLGGMVTGWLHGGSNAAVASWKEAKATLTPDEYRVSGNMILTRCADPTVKHDNSSPTRSDSPASTEAAKP